MFGRLSEKGVLEVHFGESGGFAPKFASDGDLMGEK